MSRRVRQRRELRAAASALLLAFAPVQTAFAEIEWSPVTGEVTLRYMGYFEDSPREDRNNFGEGEILARIVGQLSKKWQLSMTPLLQADTANKTAGEFRLLEDQPQRPAATFGELHLTYYGDKYEVAFGKQLFSWGVGHLVKPTDNLNAIDFLDVPTNHKLGVPAVSVFRYGSKIDAHLVLLPYFIPHRLPGLDNRWANISQELVDLFRDIFGVDPEIVLGRDLPPTTLENLQGGLRLSSSSLAAGWDLEFSLFRGFEPFGVFAIEVDPPRVFATALFPEYWEIGGGFSTARGRFVFHGELAYHKTVEEKEDDDYYQYVAGFTYTLDHHIPATLDNILFVVEYVGEHLDQERTPDGLIITSGFNRVFTNTAFARTDFVFSERTVLELGGGTNFNDGDYTARLQLTHTFIDALRLQAGFDYFSGDPGTFFGNWSDNDRFFLFGTYFF